jgi:hypothetical protein
VKQLATEIKFDKLPKMNHVTNVDEAKRISNKLITYYAQPDDNRIHGMEFIVFLAPLANTMVISDIEANGKDGYRFELSSINGRIKYGVYTVNKDMLNEELRNSVARAQKLSIFVGMPINVKRWMALKAPGGKWIQDSFNANPQGTIQDPSAIEKIRDTYYKKWLAEVKKAGKFNVPSAIYALEWSKGSKKWMDEQDAARRAEYQAKEAAEEAADKDISSIYIFEEPPTRSEGDNTIYTGTLYWPKEYTIKCYSDGDTISIKNPKATSGRGYWLYSDKARNLFKVRFLGINAPEVDHLKSDGTWEWGGKSRKKMPGDLTQQQLYDLLHDEKGNPVEIILDACDVQQNTYGDDRGSTPDGRSFKKGDVLVGHDAYGRRLCIVYAKVPVKTPDGKTSGHSWINVNRTLIARGLANLYLLGADGHAFNCHRNHGTAEHPPIQAWGADNTLSGGIDKIVKHIPQVTTGEKVMDDRNEVLGPFDPYTQVRIGDCQFVIPPEQISVTYISKSERIPSLRSRGSIRKDTGQGIRRIQMSIYFTGLDQINGRPYLNAERDKDGNIIKDKNGKPKYRPGSQGKDGIKTYYVNGLRSLIAQFKRTPFLPIESYYFNKIHNIDAVTLQGLNVTTVDGFPDTLKATIELQEFEYITYLPCEYSFPSVFNWPIFRYYYQTALNDPFDSDLFADSALFDGNGEPVKTDRYAFLVSGYTIDRTYLKDIPTEPNARRFVMFHVIDEDALREMQSAREKLGQLISGRKKLLDNDARKADDTFIKNIRQVLRQWYGAKADPRKIEQYDRSIALLRKELFYGAPLLEYDIPDLICTSMSVYYENTITELQMQMTSTPAHQYMGGQDVYLRMTFKVDEVQLELLRRLYERTGRIIRHYGRFIDNPVLAIQNEYAQLFGVDSVMIEQMDTKTIPGQPGVYEVELVLVDCQRTARRMAELQQYCSTQIHSRLGTDAAKAAEYGKQLLAEKKKIAEITHLTDEEIKLLATKHEEDIKPSREGDPAAVLESYFKTVDALKLVELYPDLELPTYTQLKSAGFIVGNVIGGEIANFVEPDFYIQTSVPTIGEQVAIAGKDAQTIKMWDNVGSKPETWTSPTFGELANRSAQDYWHYVNRSEPVGAELTRAVGNSQYSEEDMKTITQTNALHSRGEQRLQLDYIEFFTHKDHAQEVEFRKKGYVPFHTVLVKGKSNGKFPLPKSGDYIMLTGVNPYAYRGFINDKVFHVGGVSESGPSKSGVTYQIYVTNETMLNDFNKRYKNRIQNGADPNDHVKAWTTKELQTMKERAPIFVEVDKGFIIKNKDRIKKIWFGFDAPKGCQRSGKQKKNGITYAYEFMGKPTKSEYGHPTWLDSRRRYKYTWPYSNISMIIWDDGSEPLVGELYVGPQKTKSVEVYTIFYDSETGKITMDEYLKTIEENIQAQAGHEMPVVVHRDELEKSAKQDEDYKRINGYINGLFKTFDFDKKEVFDEASEFYDGFGNGPGQDTYNTDPAKTYLMACQDMLAFDRRNKLARAFPTFHLSLIDEGRIIGQWKLHDNFYGFQALSSISVHRSRKMVADTCIIELIDCFKSLSEYDLENTDYYGRPTLWDALKAVWLTESYVKKLEKQRPDNLKSVYLQTGTRVSLRLGYGSDASSLPVVFNGTITEIGGEDIITITCQNDGIELTNIITGRTDATTGTWPSLTTTDITDNLVDNKSEPRHLICDMFTMNGGFWQKAINKISNDRFFNYNSLGIAHFGSPSVNIGGWYGKEGECGQNIYRGRMDGLGYRRENELPFNMGDVVFCMSLFNKSPWDIVQTCAMATPDYIASVVPFGFRNTLFFGKPYFNVVYDYYREQHGIWTDVHEKRKAFQQLHLINSYTDIIENQIKASAQDIYTNVIGTYKGLSSTRTEETRETTVIHTDIGIFPEKQKTTVVDTGIVCRGFKPFDLLGRIPGVNVALQAIQWVANQWIFEERVAERVARAALRDFLKDMYQGEILVIGDPTVKPYDLVDLADVKNQMTGIFEVKEVVHHFSEKTGFITTITPDLCVVNEDHSALARWGWLHSLAVYPTIKTLSEVSMLAAMKRLGFNHPYTVHLELAANAGLAAGKVLRRTYSAFLKGTESEFTTGMTRKILNFLGRGGTKIGKWGMEKVFGEAAVKDVMEVITKKGAEELTEASVKSMIKSSVPARVAGRLFKGLKDGAEAMKTAAGGAGLTAFVIEYVVFEALCRGLGEKINRELRNRHAVIMMPLRQRGIKLTAGINGHMGCVFGDPVSAWDKLAEKFGRWMDFLFPGAAYEFKSYEEKTMATDDLAVLAYNMDGANLDSTIAETNSEVEPPMNNVYYTPDPNHKAGRVNDGDIVIKFNGTTGSAKPILDNSNREITVMVNGKGVKRTAKEQNDLAFSWNPDKYMKFRRWTQEDKITLALMIQIEGSPIKYRGTEYYKERLGIGAVIVNRMIANKTSSVFKCVASHAQFQSYPQRFYGVTYIDKNCLQAAEEVMRGVDITDGCYFFASRNPKAYTEGSMDSWKRNTDGTGLLYYGGSMFGWSKNLPRGWRRNK